MHSVFFYLIESTVKSCESFFTFLQYTNILRPLLVKITNIKPLIQVRFYCNDAYFVLFFISLKNRSVVKEDWKMNLLGIVALSILAVGYATDWEAGLKAEDLAIRR